MHMRRIQYERFLIPALALSAACHLLAALVPAGTVDFLFHREILPTRTVRFEVVELIEEPLRVLQTRENDWPRVTHTKITGAPPLPKPRLSSSWKLAALAPDLSAFTRPETDPVPPLQPTTRAAANADSLASVDSYISNVLARIEQARLYPETARRMSQQGDVVVAFTIGQDGGICQPASLVEASPFSPLNRAACSSVKRSAPFPSLPPCIGSDTLPLMVTIRFELQ
jgi:TonB family protein